MLAVQDGVTALHDTLKVNFAEMAKSDELAKLGIYLQFTNTARTDYHRQYASQNPYMVVCS
jgi:hypothetical protein